jgi:hypothetical protein
MGEGEFYRHITIAWRSLKINFIFSKTMEVD